METKVIFNIDNIAGFTIEEYPRGFVTEITKGLSGVHYKSNKSDLMVGNVKIGEVMKPRLTIEKSLYVLRDGKLVEFNPFLLDFEEQFNDLNKEELETAFSYIESVYHKVLELKGEKVEEIEEVIEDKVDLTQILSKESPRTLLLNTIEETPIPTIEEVIEDKVLEEVKAPTKKVPLTKVTTSKTAKSTKK